MILNGIHTAQSEKQIEMFHNIIDKYKVSLFVELGTYKGGLTYEMILRQSDTFRVLSFQLDMSELDPIVRGRPEIIEGDVFSSTVIDIVRKSIVETEGSVLIFCDNGNKPKEFYTYYPLLRKEDLIQVHDYPGEATPEFCKDVNDNYSDLEAIDYEYYLANGTVLWRKI